MDNLQPQTTVTDQNPMPKLARAYKVSPSGRPKAEGPSDRNLSPSDDVPVTSTMEPRASGSHSTSSLTDSDSKPGPSAPPSDKPAPKRRLRFEERYDRITLYLEKAVHRKVRELYESGEVENLTALLNDAVKNYLAVNFDI